jgi:predicted metal-dependent peptidase
MPKPVSNVQASSTDAARKARLTLRMACASLPHLSGVANVVRVIVDARVATAGITASGKLLVNPNWFNELDLADATFVMAHEMLHLCLESHGRGVGTEHEVFNWAHDYIINDMLAEEFGRRPPRGGLEYVGARDLSAEKIVTMMRGGQIPSPGPMPRSTMRAALEDAGLLPESRRDLGPGTGDVISLNDERELFPDADLGAEQQARQRVRAAAAKALSLAKLKGRLDEIERTLPASAPRDQRAVANAMRGLYAPPWELALQHWMEAMAPGPRSYARPSRRGAGESDAVLAGRTRVGWTLHVVLDTSGSMEEQITRVLGLIAAFCESTGVGQVHVVQCDERVTRDEWVEPEELWSYTVQGFGGSDMSPAMLALAGDPEVEAVIVITDGAINFPDTPVPYAVLWAVTDAAMAETWRPEYGTVVGVAGEGVVG